MTNFVLRGWHSAESLFSPTHLRIAAVAHKSSKLCTLYDLIYLNMILTTMMPLAQLHRLRHNEADITAEVIQATCNSCIGALRKHAVSYHDKRFVQVRVRPCFLGIRSSVSSFDRSLRIRPQRNLIHLVNVASLRRARHIWSSWCGEYTRLI